MADDSRERGQRDSDHINVNRDQDCRYWSDKFGVSVDKIKDAVKAVGPRVKDVERQLRNDADLSRSA